MMYIDYTLRPPHPFVSASQHHQLQRGIPGRESLVHHHGVCGRWGPGQGHKEASVAQATHPRGSRVEVLEPGHQGTRGSAQHKDSPQGHKTRFDYFWLPGKGMGHMRIICIWGKIPLVRAIYLTVYMKMLLTFYNTRKHYGDGE